MNEENDFLKAGFTDFPDMLQAFIAMHEMHRNAIAAGFTESQANDIIAKLVAYANKGD